MSRNSVLITPPPSQNESEPEVPSFVGRRSVRLAIEIPIIARGTSVNGRPFNENIWTVSVNKYGARLAMIRPLAVGTQLVLENPVLGRSAKARVIHLFEKKFPEVHYEIGVELLEGQDVWGMEFPPVDGQRSVPAATVPDVPQSPSEAAPPAPAATPDVPTGPAAPEEAADLAAQQLTQGGERAEEPVESGVAAAGVPPVAQQMGERSEVPKEEMAKPVVDLDAQLVTIFPEAVGRPEQKEEAVQSLEQSLNNLVSSSEAPGGEVEGLLAKIQEVLKVHQAEKNTTQRPGEQGSGTDRFRPYNYPEHPSMRAARAAAEEVKKRLREELEAASSSMVEKIRRRLQEVSSAALEASSVEAAARLAALTEENLSRWVAELQTQRAQAVEHAKDQMNQIVATVEAPRRELESLLAKIQEVHQLYLAEVDKTQREAEQATLQAPLSTAKEVKKRLREELEAVSSSMVEEARRRLQEVSSAALEASSREAAARLGALTKENLSRSAAELQAQRTQAAEHAKDQMSQIVATTEAPRRELMGLLAKIQEVHQLHQAEVDKIQRQAEQGSGTAKFKVYHYTEPITWQAPHSAAEGAEKRLREEVGATSSNMVEEVRRRLQEVSSAALEASSVEAAARLSALTEENLSGCVAELQAQRTKAAEHAKDLMSQIVETTAASLRDRAEQTAAAMASSLSQKLAKLTQESGEHARAVSQNATCLIEGSGQEIRQRIEAEMAGAAAETQRRFEQGVSERLNAALASLNDAAREAKAGCETALATTELEIKVSSERCAEGFQKLAGAALEEFRRKADAGNDSIVSQLDLALGQFREEIRGALFAELEHTTDTLLDSSARRLQDRANETLEMVCAQLQDTAKVLEEESKKRLASVHEPHLNSFSQDARAVVEGHRCQLEAMLRDFQQQSEKLAGSTKKLLEETENQLSTATRAAAETIVTQTRNTAESLQTLNQLTTSARTSLEDGAKQCAALVESALAALIREAQAREMMSGQLTAQARSVVEDAEKQLGAAARGSLESLKKEAQAAVDGCRAELPKMVLEFRDRGGHDLELYFQGVVERQRETWSTQLRKETEDSGQRALTELRHQFDQVASEASDVVHKQVGRAAFVLKDWADQASARLETAFQHSLDAFQKQIAEASASALERHRQESAVFFESVHNLLNEATRLFRQKPGE